MPDTPSETTVTPSEAKATSGDTKASKWGLLRFLWITAAVLVLDFVTKLYTVKTMALYESIEVLPFFNYVRVHNEGAAFSFLADQSGWQRWALALVSGVVSIVLVVWLKRLKPQERWLAVSLALVLGGALGNLYDRLVYGYVVDFLDFHGSIFEFVMGSSHFPAFNVADIAISIGGFMLVVDAIRNPNSK